MNVYWIQGTVLKIFILVFFFGKSDSVSFVDFIINGKRYYRSEQTEMYWNIRTICDQHGKRDLFISTNKEFVRIGNLLLSHKMGNLDKFWVRADWSWSGGQYSLNWRDEKLDRSLLLPGDFERGKPHCWELVPNKIMGYATNLHLFSSIEDPCTQKLFFFCEDHQEDTSKSHSVTPASPTDRSEVVTQTTTASYTTMSQTDDQRLSNATTFTPTTQKPGGHTDNETTGPSTVEPRNTTSDESNELLSTFTEESSSPFTKDPPTKDPPSPPTKDPPSLPTKDPRTKDPRTKDPRTKDPPSSPTKDVPSLPTKDPPSLPTKHPPTKDPPSSPTKNPPSLPTKDPPSSPTKDPPSLPTKDPPSSPTKDPQSPPTKEPLSPFTKESPSPFTTQSLFTRDSELRIPSTRESLCPSTKDKPSHSTKGPGSLPTKDPQSIRTRRSPNPPTIKPPKPITTNETTNPATNEPPSSTTKEPQSLTQKKTTVTDDVSTASSTNRRDGPCRCACSKSKLGEEIMKDKRFQEKLRDEIKKELRVNVRKLSSQTRRLISARDDRPSSTMIGLPALVGVLGILAAILLSDCVNLYYGLLGRWKYSGATPKAAVLLKS